jgi:hypothetical protein
MPVCRVLSKKGVGCQELVNAILKKMKMQREKMEADLKLARQKRLKTTAEKSRIQTS